MKGQAMVEMALITPILLLLILGTFQVGLVILTRMELMHAAQQAAAAGARDPEPANRCTVAEETATTVYEGPMDEVECTSEEVVEITLRDDVLSVAPLGPWTVTVSARAAP